MSHMSLYGRLSFPLVRSKRVGLQNAPFGTSRTIADIIITTTGNLVQFVWGNVC